MPWLRPLPRLCVCDWSDWREFVINAVWPRAHRIPAEFGQTPQDIAAQLPRGATILLPHLDISDPSPFIKDGSEWIALMAQHGVRVLNVLTPDIRKTTIQSCCRDFDLLSATVSPAGPDDEWLIVKTDLNSGGEREQLLTESQKIKFGLPASPGRMKSPADYFIARRGNLRRYLVRSYARC